MAKRPEPAVKALIEDDGKILALKNDLPDGVLWNIPGGRIEFGEKPVAALHREVREEVSIDITVHEPVGMYQFFFGPDGQNQVVATVFRCSRDGGDVDIMSNPDEQYISDYAWVTPEHVVEWNIEPSLETLIRRRYDLPR